MSLTDELPDIPRCHLCGASLFQLDHCNWRRTWSCPFLLQSSQLVTIKPRMPRKIHLISLDGPDPQDSWLWDTMPVVRVQVQAQPAKRDTQPLPALLWDYLDELPTLVNLAYPLAR